MTNSRIAVIVGFIVKSPVAGMAAYNFHYIAGLRELGYEVHYIERLNAPDECYDPGRDAFGDDPGYGLAWLRDTTTRLPPLADSWTLIDRNGNHHGMGRPELCGILDKADFVLTLADPTWFDDLERCARRAFVDGDPLFTQAAMLDPGSRTSSVLAHYPTLFTYWTRQNAKDTTVPTAGRHWISTRPVVATSLWIPKLTPPGAPVTTVMNWGAWDDVVVQGRSYGHKDREFERLIDLPRHTSRRLVLAVGGPAPKERLASHGWELADPLCATRTIDSYREFIDGSYADLGIAKHAYIASRSGWFSDRSLCYLASGRPVLHQDTGFQDWLETGEGIFAFSNVDDIVAALEKIDRDYRRHAKAARAAAEQNFEARTVIGRMLDDCRFR
jgi:hypothetical protein